MGLMAAVEVPTKSPLREHLGSRWNHSPISGRNYSTQMQMGIPVGISCWRDPSLTRSETIIQSSKPRPTTSELTPLPIAYRCPRLDDSNSGARALC